MGKIILVIVIVIVVGAGTAFAGYRMGDTAGFERANQVRQQFAQQRQGGQSGQFTQGGAAAGRAFALQGTVKSVSGDTVTITVGNRDVTVKLNDKTQILKSVASTRTDLAAGARVMVTPEGGAAASGGGAGTGGGTGSGGGTGGRTGGAQGGQAGGGAGGADSVTAAEITILPAQ